MRPDGLFLLLIFIFAVAIFIALAGFGKPIELLIESMAGVLGVFFGSSLERSVNVGEKNKMRKRAHGCFAK